MDLRKCVGILIAAVLLSGMTACGEKTDSAGKDDAAVSTEGSNDATEEMTDDATDKTGDASSPESLKLDFTTTDINGASFGDEDIKDAKLIMVNFWEPWCGPCVGEMPELEQLYQDYKDQGFVIVGAFYSSDDLEDAKAIVADLNISYPVVMGNKDLSPFTSGYVPTTVFFDGEGNLLSGKAIVGAKSYHVWEKEVQKYLDD